MGASKPLTPVTEEEFDSKIRQTVLTFSNAIIGICLILLLVLSLYVFIPESVLKTKSDNSTTTIDSTRTETKKDTVILDSLKKVYNQVETKNITSHSNQPNNTSNTTETSVKDKMETAFKYYALLLGVILVTLLLPRIKSFTANSTGISFDTYEKKIMNQDVEKNLDPAARDKVTLNTDTHAMKIAELTETEKTAAPAVVQYEDDPQKGKWGGKAEANGRKISAIVTPSPLSKELFDITLTVSASSTGKLLEGFVVFHLHPTFTNSRPVIYVINGVAELKLQAWGAFTVGVEADNGSTKLELDLATIPNAPDLFKSR